MTLTYQQAREILESWTKTDALLKHARAVELVMRQAAWRFGRGAQDEELYALAGLLHDADYEAWPDEHPKRIVAWLREREAQDLAHAISAHYTKWGVPHDSMLDKTLLACDELTGFVGACARVRPGGLASLEARSVLKRLKEKSFAAKVEREEIAQGARLLGLEVDDLAQFVIDALRPHAKELGL